MRYDVQKIKQAVSMSELVQKYGVDIRHSMCCCPFHGERHPSMKIYRDSYYCFACGAHGDIFTWVQQSDGLNFPQAVERICDMFNLSPEKQETTYADRKQADLYNMYKFVQRKIKELQPKNTDEYPSREFWEYVKIRNDIEEMIKK